MKYYLGFDEDETETKAVNRSEDLCHPLCQCPRCLSVQEVQMYIAHVSVKTVSVSVKTV